MREIETVSELKEVTATGVVVLDFFAPWCGPCKLLLPRLEKLAEERPDVTFVKIDVDKLPAVAEGYHVRAVPSLVLIRDGQPVQEFTGPQSELSLRKVLA